MAVGLLAGAPTLTAGEALRTAVATGAQAGLIATGAGVAAGSAIRGTQGAMQMARNVNGASQMAGMAGVARLAGTSSRELAAHTVRRFTQPQRAPLGTQVSRMIPHD